MGGLDGASYQASPDEHHKCMESLDEAGHRTSPDERMIQRQWW